MRPIDLALEIAIWNTFDLAKLHGANYLLRLSNFSFHIFLLVTSDCLSIKNQVTLNENNTPYNFVPDTEKSCTNDFYNSYHQLQVTYDKQFSLPVCLLA